VIARDSSLNRKGRSIAPRNGPSLRKRVTRAGCSIRGNHAICGLKGGRRAAMLYLMEPTATRAQTLIVTQSWCRRAVSEHVCFAPRKRRCVSLLDTSVKCHKRP
jgi:hypothetical protein